MFVYNIAINRDQNGSVDRLYSFLTYSYMYRALDSRCMEVFCSPRTAQELFAVLLEQKKLCLG